MPSSENTPFTEQELALFRELDARGVRFMLVGLSAAVLQGADTTTQDLDLWFESLTDPGIEEAARAAGGFYATPTQPPMLSGDGLDRIDVVSHCDGLDAFADELPNTTLIDIADAALRILNLDRIIASKEAAARDKDLAVLPQLRAALSARSG